MSVVVDTLTRENILARISSVHDIWITTWKMKGSSGFKSIVFSFLSMDSNADIVSFSLL